MSQAFMAWLCLRTSKYTGKTIRQKTRKTQVWKSMLVAAGVVGGRAQGCFDAVVVAAGALRTQRKPMASRARQASEKPGVSPMRYDDRRASAGDFHEPPRRTFSLASAGPRGIFSWLTL